MTEQYQGHPQSWGPPPNQEQFPQGYQGPGPNYPAPKKNWFKRHPVWTVVLAVVAVVIAGSAIGSTSSTTEEDQSGDATSQVQDATRDAGEPDKSEPVEKPEPELTVSQEQAVMSAQSYLDMTGFSKAGLIDQLTSNYADNFSEDDARFAVRYLNPDWNQEAVQAGKAYLDMGGFSYNGLIDQLSSNYGDQFTTEQATYAADKLF